MVYEVMELVAWKPRLSKLEYKEEKFWHVAESVSLIPQYI